MTIGAKIAACRKRAGMSQEKLANELNISRQAVSRWENGETTPNTETLKLLSKLFDVSINTLLGSPRQLICQCCGMPLADGDIAGRQTAFSMRSTASGAMLTASICTTI